MGGVDGRFRLTKVAGGVMHYADVAVRVDRAQIDRIVVSDEVFAWRLEVYGPDAWPGPDDPELVAASVAGVRYALDRGGAGASLVTVRQIRLTYVDTTPDGVKFAAAMATCAALGIELDPAPSLEPAGFVFPP